MADFSDEFDDYGPAMRALKSDERRRFVLAVVDQPKKNWMDAARRAGFRAGLHGGSKRNFKQIGYRLAHDDRILDAIEEVCAKRFKIGGVIAMSGLIAMASDPRNKNHLRACESLADRAGYGAEQRISVDHTHTDRSPAALVDAITKSALALGLDIEVVKAKLLGAAAAPAPMKVIEHEQPEAKND